MPKKRRSSNSAHEKRSSEGDDDDYFYDEGCSSVEPQHRNAANARERARMRVLSKAFCRLKTRLPWVPADTKLSKLDTLRLAASYIAHLRALLHDAPHASTLCPHPLNLAWPFAFQHGCSNNSSSMSPKSSWTPPQSETSSPTGNLGPSEAVGHQDSGLFSSCFSHNELRNDTIEDIANVQYDYHIRNDYLEPRTYGANTLMPNI